MRKSVRYFAIPLALATVTAVATVTASLAASSQNAVVSAVPSTATPNIMNGTTFAITRVGNDIIAGGTFTQVENRGSTTVLSRPDILAFDATTGIVETGFAPVLDGQVSALLPGPAANTVYVGGQFANVSGVKHPKLVLLNTLTGAVVSTFKSAALNGAVNSLAISGNRLYVGGLFTTVGGPTHAGIATENATTGALDPYMNVQVAGHHNWVTGSKGAKAGVGVTTLKLSPDGTKLIAIGNFKTVNGLDRDQAVLINLGATADVANWETDALKGACSSSVFDDWVRDVDFSPDGTYFVIVGTGGPHAGQDCDSSMRFEASATGTGIKPTWIDFAGGDTFLSVAITGPTVYVGGHFRWLNNSFGSDSSAAGAVGRPALAALDPVTGLPQPWNPGRNPRGYGTAAMYVDGTNGLYIGSDTDYIGNSLYHRGKIAYFPLSGGMTPAAGHTASLPATLYSVGTQVPLPDILYRVNAGGAQTASTDGGPAWSADDGTGAQYSSGGTISTLNKDLTKTDPSLPADTPLSMFSSERDYTATTAAAYTFPIPTGTQVSVNVFFAQRGWDTALNAPAARQLTVSVNGTVVDPSLDLNATFGYNTAGMRTYSATSNGTVKIGLTPIAGSAEIDAIEIDRTGGTSSALGVTSRSYDGATFGTAIGVPTVDGTPWNNTRGAFLVDHTLFYGLSDGNLYRRTFDGTSFGTPSVVNPYSDPVWDGVATGSGTSVYTGIKSNFYAEINSLTSMFFLNGKLYYTRTGQTGINWRWFNEDSGIVGADEFSVTGASGFNTVGGTFFVSGSNLYFSKTDGKLYKMGWTNGAPSGTATAVSGPGIDANTWTTPTFIGN